MPKAQPQKVDMHAFPAAPQEVYALAPSGAEIAAWEQSGIEFDKRGRIKNAVKPFRKAELIVLCITDAEGKRVWGTAESDAKTVAKLDAGLVNHLFKAATKAIGQGEHFEDDEEDEGN